MNSSKCLLPKAEELRSQNKIAKVVCNRLIVCEKDRGDIICESKLDFQLYCKVMAKHNSVVKW